jgi:hypothetical protein
MNIKWLRQITSVRFLDVVVCVLLALGTLALARALWLFIRPWAR